MLKMCDGPAVQVFVVNPLTFVSSIFADFDSVVLFSRAQCTNIMCMTTIIAKTMNMAKLIAERAIDNLESTITIVPSFPLSGSAPVPVWSLVVKWSISLASDSVTVVAVGSFMVAAEVDNDETSGITDAVPVIVAADSVFVPSDGQE